MLMALSFLIHSFNNPARQTAEPPVLHRKANSALLSPAPRKRVISEALC
jgi:hypothetical protein